jgi:hypothetical protein
MLMTPLSLKMAQERPRWRVEIARAGTDLLVQALRERVLDALVVDAPDLVELKMQPALAATARFGLVTLRRRTVPPGLAAVRALMTQLLIDGPIQVRRAP